MTGEQTDLGRNQARPRRRLRPRRAIKGVAVGTSDDPATFTFNNALTSGDLTASFPGAPNVPLWGPGFTATMNFYRYEEQ